MGRVSPAVVLSMPSIATWISASKCVGASLVSEISIPSIVAGPRSTTGVEPCAGASTSTPDQYCHVVMLRVSETNVRRVESKAVVMLWSVSRRTVGA
eukprot:COSAG04_NODE_1045_length_8578_cov_9.398396_8_plen_97_part_00